MVTSDYKACNPVLLPRHIGLEDIDKNVTPELMKKLDSVYHEKEITVVVVFKHLMMIMITMKKSSNNVVQNERSKSNKRRGMILNTSKG